MRRLSNRALGLTAIVSISYVVIVMVAMHLLQPEFSPVRLAMSAHVLGAYGGLMTTSYFALCVGWLALSYGLVASLPVSRITRIGFAVALVACSGLLVAGIFPMDMPPPPVTASGRLHLLGGLPAFPSMTLASVLFSLSVRRVARRSRVSAVTSALSIGIAGAFILTMSSVLILGFGGYAQRILLVLLFSWMIVVGFQLYSQNGLRDEA